MYPEAEVRPTIQPNVFHTIEANFNNDRKFKQNGVVAYSNLPTLDVTITQRIPLFAVRAAGTEYLKRQALKSIIFTRGTTVVADFIPVKYVSGNTTTYGMYDLMDNNPATAFHTNKGTGEFIAGPVVQ